VGILGGAEAQSNGATVDLGTLKQRALLVALAMHRGRPVPPDTLVDLLWGEAPPAAGGRQTDALEVLRQVRELLAEETRLEPGPELRALQTAVLRQDPGLAWTGVPSQRRPHRTSVPAASPTTRHFGWPLVSRDDPLAALIGVLEQFADHPVFAVITW